MTPLLLLRLLGALVHPLHTSHTELTEARPAEVTVRIRAFRDDLQAMVGAANAPPDSAIARYLRRTVELRTARREPVVLRWEGMQPDGDITHITLRAVVPGGLAGAEVRLTLGTDRFPDQVNVVRARYGRREVNLLFLAGDGTRRLP